MNRPAVTDYLGITVAPDDDQQTWEGVCAVLTAAGATEEVPEALWRLGGSGTVKRTPRARFVAYGFSGAALGALRDASQYQGLLMALSAVPHKVTRLDAAVDYPVDGPDQVARSYDLGRGGQVRFGQRRLSPRHVSRVVSSGLEGRETGTAYLGKRVHDLMVKVYDKRQERVDKGLADPGPLTRVELTAKARHGVCLRDAWDPTALFYHSTPGVLLPEPVDQVQWSPGAIGLELPPVVPVLPYQRVKRLVEGHADLRRLGGLSVELGPKGLDMVLSLVRRELEAGAVAAPRLAQSNPVKGARSAA